MEDNYLEIKTTKKKTKQIQNKNGVMAEQDQFRVVMNKESNAALEQLVLRANMNFESGHITKSDLVHYLFSNTNKWISDSDIKILQTKHFDDKKALIDLAQSEAELPENIKKAVRELHGLLDASKKKASRVSSEISTEASVDNIRTL